ncbi:MAG: hypothetical protein ABSH20_15270 [Tepidisphaeraceae bacterium]|jgi:hypothetical protein
MIRQSCLFLMCVLAGCASGTRPADTAAPPADVQALPVCGPWTELGAGLRMRVCVDRTIAEETSIVRAALVVQNSSSVSAALAGDATRPLYVWRVDDMSMVTSSAGRDLSLAAGQTWTSPMVEIGMPPNAPRREIRAALALKGATAVAVMPITVTPAKWGEPVAGLRLRLGIDREKYAAGEKTSVRMFLHNTTDKPLTVHPLDQASRDQESHKDRLNLWFKTVDDRVTELQPGGFITTTLDEPLLLAPGRYRLKATIVSKELSVDHPVAWVGSVISNDVEFSVE